MNSLLKELPDNDLYYLIISFGLFGLGTCFFALYERGPAYAAVAAATAPPKLESTTGLLLDGVMLKMFEILFTLVLNGLVTFLDTTLLLFC